VYGYNNIVNNNVDKFVYCIVILSYCLIVRIVSNLYILSGIVDNIVESINHFVDKFVCDIVLLSQ
jgi:hypothetical protein